MNKVVHFEIPFDDKERASKFYSETFGWELQDFPMEGVEEGYTVARTAETDENHMIREPGAINGGMYKRGQVEHFPTSPVITIGVDSIDDHIKKVEEAGGEMVVPKGEVPNIGYYAYVEDTEGNIIGLWEDLKKE